MIDRIKFAKRLFDVGLYQARGLFAAIVTLCGMLGVLASLTVDRLPTQLKPYITSLNDIGLWSLGIAAVGTAILAQSKKVLPSLPLQGAPTLLDDETGQ